jgi:hypothetical protein
MDAHVACMTDRAQNVVRIEATRDQRGRVAIVA